MYESRHSQSPPTLIKMPPILLKQLKKKNPNSNQLLSYSCVCCVFVSLSAWENVNKIASSRITETGWRAGWPCKSCSRLASGLLSCILKDFRINAFAGNLLCHSEGFLAKSNRKMNALSYLARLSLQALQVNNTPHTPWSYCLRHPVRRGVHWRNRQSIT